MLAEPELARLCVVLVRARNPNNIGAVARAMHGFGFRHLRLVNDFTVPLQEARSAVDASSVLNTAEEFVSVEEAVSGCTLVVGTSAGGSRRQEHPRYTLAQAGDLLRSALAGEGSTANAAPKVALLFGSEKTGLSRAELSHCHWILNIPMHPRPGLRHASMNLGQAAAVCLYELVREAGLPQPVREAAPSSDLERLTGVLAETLQQSGYGRSHPGHAREAQLRQLVHRMNLDLEDARLWTGILRQLLGRLRREDQEPTP